MGIEQNLKASFRDVKLDIISVKGQLLRFAEEQKELREMIVELKNQISSGKNAVVKKSVKKNVVKKKVVKKISKKKK